MSTIPVALLSASLTLFLSACTTPGAALPASCDGHHRRPANPNGSVLDPSTTQPVKPAPTKSQDPPAPSLWQPGGPGASAACVVEARLIEMADQIDAEGGCPIGDGCQEGVVGKRIIADVGLDGLSQEPTDHGGLGAQT